MHIVLLKCPHVQIVFLKFTSCDNQAIVGCIPIAAICCTFEAEIIKIGQSSHKMYSDNILNFHWKKCHAMKAGSTAMTQRPRDRVPSGSMLALLDPKRPDRANPPTNLWWSLFWQHWHDQLALGSTGLTVNKEYYVEILSEFRKRFGRKRPALFKSGQWHFHQDNAPVPNSILVTDYLTKMGIKTVRHPPYSLDLSPCDFYLFPKLRGCRYDTIEEMKEAVTKVIDTLTQEDFHGAFQKLLERYNKCIATRGGYIEGD